MRRKPVTCMCAGGSVTDRFTFTLTERDISVLLDALEHATVSPPPDSGWGRDTYAGLSALLEARIEW